MERNCRMCLADGGQNQFQRFSHKLEDSLSVYDYYKLFTSVNLRNQDERTKSKVCYKCLQKLLIFYNDRCKAITNNEKMWNWCDEAIDPTASAQEPTELVKVESNISGYQDSLDPLFDKGINTEKVKVEDELLDFYSDNDIGPSSDVESLTTVQDYWESLTKPCKVVLERCNEISIPGKCEYSNQTNTDHDYSEIRNLRTQQEKKTFTNQVEPLAMPNTDFNNLIKPVTRGTSKLPKSKRKRRRLTLQPVTTQICPICGDVIRYNRLNHHRNTVHFKIKRFFCDICPNGYYLENQLKSHKKGHDEPTIPCTQEGCTRKFSTEYRLVRHIRACHNESKDSFPCTYPNCEKAFKTKGELNNHIKYKHISELTHVCSICNAAFLYKSSFNEHMKTHEEKNLICDGCGKKFSSKIRINLHYRQRHLPAPLAGSIRQKKKPVAIKNTDDTNRTNRVTRIVPRLTKVPPKKKSTKAKPEMCPICGEILKCGKLNHHQNTVHFKIKRFFCDICPNGYYLENQLKSHKKVHDEPTIPCTKDGCTKMYSSEQRLVRHIRACHNESKDSFPCTYPNCGTVCGSKNRLKGHIKYKHIKEKTHFCPICKAGFMSPTNLREHVAIHGERKFTCDLCGKTFSSKVRIAGHFRNMHLPSSLACSICGKKYRNNHTALLKMHMLDHQNIRPHPCEICSKPFKSVAFKNEHIRAVHFKSKIKCELCGRSFPRTGYYKVHVKEKHEDLGAERIQEWVARIENIYPDYNKLEWVYP